VPEVLQIVLAFAGVGTLVGTAGALILVTRFPNLHHLRFIGLWSVMAAAAGLLFALVQQL
jgi:hypothetical protein